MNFHLHSYINTQQKCSKKVYSVRSIPSLKIKVDFILFNSFVAIPNPFTLMDEYVYNEQHY